MKSVIIVIAALLTLTSVTIAQTDPARVVVEKYLEAGRKLQFDTDASFIDPHDLGRFKWEVSIFLHGLDSVNVKPDTFLTCFAGATNYQSMMDADSVTFFKSMEKWLITAMPELKELELNSTQNIIGVVPEGEKLRHYVYRMNSTVGGDPLSEVDFVSMKKIGDKWVVSLEGKMEKILDIYYQMFVKLTI